MIKNEKQYRISKKRLAEMEQSIKSQKASINPGSKEEGAFNSLLRIANDLKEEIKQYERLQSKGLPLRRKISIAQLPAVLIEYKIAKGFTQKQYAEILGIKEQQLQRYEAENYNSVSFGRLLSYIEKAAIKVNLAIE